MTTFGFIITLLGAGSIAANVLRLIDCIDKPAARRPRTAERKRKQPLRPWRNGCFAARAPHPPVGVPRSSLPCRCTPEIN